MPSDDDATRVESLPCGVDSYYRTGNIEDPSPIVYPAAASGAVSNFEIQSNLIAILPVFRGREKPYVHLWEFFSITDTYLVNKTTKDGVSLYLFPFSLKDQAKAWFISLDPGKGIPNMSQVSHDGFSMYGDPSHSNEELAKKVHKQEVGKLPSYPALNPKHKPGDPEHVNMVTSLRNGKTYNNDIKIPSVHEFSHDVEDFVTNDEIVVEGKKADYVKSDSELVNDMLKDFPKPPTKNPEATKSPKVREGGMSSKTTPYPAALEKSAFARLAKKASMDSCWTCGYPFHSYENCPKEIGSRTERVPETYDYRSQYDACEYDTYHANYNIEMEDDTMYRGQRQSDELSFDEKYDKIMSMIESNKEENQRYEASFAAHEASFIALETHVDRDETYEPQGITMLDFDDEDEDEDKEHNEDFTLHSTNTMEYLTFGSCKNKEDVDDHNNSFEDLISPIKEHDKESIPFKAREEVMEANTTPYLATLEELILSPIDDLRSKKDEELLALSLYEDKCSNLLEEAEVTHIHLNPP
nr:hypothetical protein [Tanacetum cinerariifolium]